MAPATPSKVPSSSPPSSPLILPANPYNPRTQKGRDRIYRRDHLDFPDEVDQWLQANMSLWPRSDPRLPTKLVPGEVSCKVSMGYIPVRTLVELTLLVSDINFQRMEPLDADPNDPFMDWEDTERFVLYLQATMPEDSNIIVWNQSSPRAILASWYGAKRDFDAPDWCHSFDIGMSVTFPQPRAIISEFMAHLALSDANRRMVSNLELISTYIPLILMHRAYLTGSWYGPKIFRYVGTNIDAQDSRTDPTIYS